MRAKLPFTRPLHAMARLAAACVALWGSVATANAAPANPKIADDLAPFTAATSDMGLALSWAKVLNGEVHVKGKMIYLN